VLACLVNPNGLAGFALPLRYAFAHDSPFLRVGEWHAPWEPGGIRSGFYFPAIAVFLLSAVALWRMGALRADRRRTITGLALGLLTLAMSLRSRRFIPLFGIAQSLALAPALAEGLRRLRGRLERRFPRLGRPGAWRMTPAAAGLLCGCLWLAPFPLSGRAFLALTSEDNFPVEALNVVEVNHIEGKVFAYYQWGGYVDLRTNGALQVFIDGRADTVFDEKTYRDYTRVLGKSRGWEQIVADSGADYFLWPTHQREQAEVLRRSGAWRKLYADHVAILLERADRPAHPPLRPTPESPWRELTLGWNDSSAKRYREAEDHFARALQQKPDLRAACDWLANAIARNGRLDEANATVDRCERIFPDPERYREIRERFRSRAHSDDREDEAAQDTRPEARD
jgi:tetratricopeptide (TPR) repeat protein